EFARRAIKLDPNEPWGHGVLGCCLMYLRRLPEAAAHFERAEKLNPNDVFLAMLHAMWFTFMGETDQALVRMQQALTRDPFAHDWFWDDYCITLVVAGRYSEALTAFKKMAAPAPWSYVFAAIAQVNLGNAASAKSLIAQSLEAGPGMPLEDYFWKD